jgi:pimeloyl-ACP methyl ester carboxylesterase
MNIQPYTISVSPYVIEDLRERLGRARWPDEIAGSGWEYGTNLHYLRDLCTHWGHGFEWKEQEEILNGFHHFQAEVDGFCLHFIHEKGKGHHRIPILLIHGWPDSFVRFLKLIPLLTDRIGEGLSFDVVVPSIPGFGFSEKPSGRGMGPERIAGLFADLMKGLGYERYLVHGGDWGSTIAEELAIRFPDRLIGLHFTDVPYRLRLAVRPNDPTPAERAFFEAFQQWQAQEGAYSHEQSTKPQTLAYSLNDSPIGLAAWIIEKFYSWSDCNGNPESIYSRDELLTNLTIYWVTQTAGSAARLYFERRHHFRPWKGERIDVPSAFFICSRDLAPAPREFAERFFMVKQWTQSPRGGHFAAMEQPRLLAEDLFRFAEKYVAQPHTSTGSEPHPSTGGGPDETAMATATAAAPAGDRLQP